MLTRWQATREDRTLFNDKFNIMLLTFTPLEKAIVGAHTVKNYKISNGVYCRSSRSLLYGLQLFLFVS